MKNKELNILLSAPRGFCAGVERAIEIVEKSIQKYGAPVYVRHEIVHNKFVVDDLRKKGAIFVEELDEIQNALTNLILQGNFILGDSVTDFEEEITRYTLSKNCIGVNSGTDALMMSLWSADTCV